MRVCHAYEGKNGNYGDKIIGYCTRKLINRFLKPDEIVTASITERHLARYKLNNQQVAVEANNSDVCIIGGGGLLTFFYDGRININKINMPYIVYAVGFNGFYNGPTPTPKHQRILKKTTEKAVYFSVRRDGSKQYVNQKVNESVDPALWVAQFTSNLPHWNRKYVIFNFAGDCFHKRYTIHGKKWVLGKLLYKTTQYLNGLGYTVVLVPHRLIDQQYFHWAIEELNVKAMSHQRLMENMEQGLSLYKNARYVISTRGHSQYIPLSFNVPIINIATQPKNMGLMKLLKLEDYCINIWDLTVKRMKKAISRLEKHYDETVDHVKQRRSQLWRETEREWTKLESLL